MRSVGADRVWCRRQRRMISGDIVCTAFRLARYHLSAVGDRDAALRPVATGQPPVTYGLTYYPGTPHVHEAKTVKLELGQEAAGLDLTIVPVAVARITAHVVDSQDRAPTTSLMRLQPVGRSSRPRGSCTHHRTVGSSVFQPHNRAITGCWPSPPSRALRRSLPPRASRFPKPHLNCASGQNEAQRLRAAWRSTQVACLQPRAIAGRGA